MAHVAKFYGKFLLSLANKEINLNTDTFKVMLCSSLYVPDQDAHQYKSSVTNEISGTGYTAGGQTVSPLTITYNAATNQLVIDCPDAQWASASFTARVAVLYDATPASDSTRPLIGYILFDSDIPVTSSTFTVQWDSTGVATLTAA
ncbi:hypothetical protein IRT45_35415 [Nocardia sp. BSTN01]|uniref:hypothetical protein n=1 Tax=Nocardia sp. BSTN01 TaxID=2783665 RepID=UPI00188E23C4|nr:hypothetical protein [Nocardia sp. BSTN01]MBF5002408.1 hypothetical protein [Nocardia sp. BSTN01]